MPRVEWASAGIVPLALVLAFASAGCWRSGPEIAGVVGRVTMDGKPLANATVVFVPENGRPAAARTDPDGNYVLHFSEGRKGAIPGKNMVRFTTVGDPYTDADGKAIPGSKETIPPKYNGESTLEFMVEPGKRNVANFDLTSN